MRLDDSQGSANGMCCLCSMSEEQLVTWSVQIVIL